MECNSALCYICFRLISSYSVHDFRQCPCDNIFVDGGLEYQRFGWMSDDYETYTTYAARNAAVDDYIMLATNQKETK